MNLSFLFRTKKHADIIVAGLGNPGKQYAHTPHNAGFEVIDYIREGFKEQDIPLQEEHRKEYALYTASYNGQQILFVKPLLFMNVSGTVIRKLKAAYSVPYEKIWVIHDEIDLPLGTIRVSFNSQSAGNKGVQNIIDEIQTKRFHRFRIGVLPPNTSKRTIKETTSDFVTTPLGAPVRTLFESSLQECASLVIQSLMEGNPVKR